MTTSVTAPATEAADAPSPIGELIEGAYRTIVEPARRLDAETDTARVTDIETAWRNFAQTVLTANAPWFEGRVIRLVNAGHELAVELGAMALDRAASDLDSQRGFLMAHLRSVGCVDADSYLTVQGVAVVAEMLAGATEQSDLEVILKDVAPAPALVRAQYQGKSFDARIPPGKLSRIQLRSDDPATVTLGFTHDPLLACYVKLVQRDAVSVTAEHGQED